MVNRTEQPYWAFLYNDFILQTQPTRLQARLGPLEDAIVERLRHLDGTANSHAEKLAIQEAYRRLLQMKIEKLGFPPLAESA